MSAYQSALQKFRDEARREFQRSHIGRMFGEVDKMRRRGTAGRSELSKLSRGLKRVSSSSFLSSELKRSGMGKMIGQVDRYARKSMKQAILDEMLGALGPIGDILGLFLRPSGQQQAGVERELQAASELLKSFGWNVQKPGSQREADGATLDEIERSKKLLESAGFTVTPPKPEDSEPPIPQPSAIPGRVELSAGGIKFDVKPDDPLITGDWISVSSSNVHSISFLWNDATPTQGTLRIRFINKRKTAKSARGEVYHYYDVHPALFMDFRKSASKGGWVWDHLRIRGTVSGHRFRYQLASLASDAYVPRQSKRIGNEEWFIQRTVKGRNGNKYTSTLENQFVGFYDERRGGGPNRGRPNRGGPNRGGPNRGTPNRGR